MADFQHFTRGGSGPQGKPRVYFAAHPDDYRFFDEIKKEITERQNCAVFYPDFQRTGGNTGKKDADDLILISNKTAYHLLRKIPYNCVVVLDRRQPIGVLRLVLRKFPLTPD